jgi:hypothetical protein
MTEILQIAASLGVGAFLAVVIFLLAMRYIKTIVDQSREDRKYTEGKLINLAEENFTIRRDYIEKTEQLTKSLAELLTYLLRQNGNSKRG